jgi:hypothetical protein
MTAGAPNRLAGAVVLGALAAIAVAFVAGCIFALRFHDIGVMMSFGGLFAMFATPVAVLLGLVVGWPLFRYWARPRQTSIVRAVVVGLVLSAAAAFVVRISMDTLIDSDLRFAIVTAVVAGPISALTVWVIARRPSLPGAPPSSNNRWRGP